MSAAGRRVRGVLKWAIPQGLNKGTCVACGGGRRDIGCGQILGLGVWAEAASATAAAVEAAVGGENIVGRLAALHLSC